MAIESSLQTRVIALAAASLLTLSTGCEKPVVAQGTSATAGGIEFSMGDYEIRYLEVSDGSNTFEYPQPALVIPVTLKNVGKGDFAYSPTHSTQQMTEAQTPLLYQAPGPDEDLPPANKNPINGVFLSKGALEGQVTSNQSIAAGESLSDLLLFEVPDNANKLILSMPPAMHRGKFPVLFSVDFQPKEATGPTVHNVGDPVMFDKASFTVTTAKVMYVKTRDNIQGEGFSSEPLLKVSYKIENNGTESLAYDPAHRAVGGRGAALYGKDKTYKRVKFPASTSVEGQKDSASAIAAGKSIEDFVLFDRPPEGAGLLTFEYPAPLFGKSGISRVGIEYEYADPPLPKELTKKPTPAPAD